MKRTKTRASGTETGMTLIELVIVVGVIGVVSAITVPSLLRARITANETAVLGSMRAVNSAQAAYAGAASPGGYAVNFSVLVQPCPGSTQGFISPDLAVDPAQKSGYSVVLGPGTMGPGPADCNGQATSIGYYLSAVPITAGLTGHRGFASTSPGVIYFNPSGIAPTEAETLPNGGGTPIQ
jgi:prepilin-type N-terminal cleavage/methylation domain-containing protein